MDRLRITFLGTGTSQGIPQLGCECLVCASEDPRDQRTRCSVYVETAEMSLVIDTGADFRTQCLREKIRRVDGVLYTHAHTDHIMGFDDLRAFSKQGQPFPVYGSFDTLERLKGSFSFAFDGERRFPGYLHPEPFLAEAPFFLGGLEWEPLPLPHGHTTSSGYLIRRSGEPLFAYLTDCKSVPDSVVERVAGVRHVVLDALRERPHPTHMSVGEALEAVVRIRPGHAWLTHLCHEHSHREVEARLPEGVRVAFDGLKLEI